jgi:hypothetical protein
MRMKNLEYKIREEKIKNKVVKKEKFETIDDDLDERVEYLMSGRQNKKKNHSNKRD